LVTPPHEQIWLAPFGAQSGFVYWLQLLVVHEFVQVWPPVEQSGTHTSPPAHGFGEHGSLQVVPPTQQVLLHEVPPQVHAGFGNGVSGVHVGLFADGQALPWPDPKFEQRGVQVAPSPLASPQFGEQIPTPAHGLGLQTSESQVSRSAGAPGLS